MKQQFQTVETNLSQYIPDRNYYHLLIRTYRWQ